MSDPGNHPAPPGPDSSSLDLPGPNRPGPAAARFPHLLSPFQLGRVTLRNRVVSTGHHTHLADLVPNDALIAYHAARARGGVGLIVTEVTGVHPTARFSDAMLMAVDDRCIPAFAALAAAVKRHGTRIVAQLFHPGREILASTSGLIPAAWAPSAVPTERFHIMPRAMPAALIEDVIAGFGRAAGWLAAAGYDGVEIVASHGYLPAQFLNPRVNLRDDAWGGDATRRQAFLAAVFGAVRAAAPALVLGLRISGDDRDDTGLSAADVTAACTAFAGSVDYVSVVCGTSSALGASVHIVPPMGLDSGYTAPYAQAIRQATGRPVIATGRITQPQVAEAILAAGQADLCGMTRALIADQDMVAKTAAGRTESIRACIGCNQSCIGRAHKGFGLSCLQHPVSGRETRFGAAPAIAGPRRVAVVGGGAAGMKAAVTAAARGHAVTLYEQAARLGGQVLLAQKLPGRAEFGGLVTNLEAELAATGVQVRTRTPVAAPDRQGAPSTAVAADAVAADAVAADAVAATAVAATAVAADVVIIATGAVPYIPDFAGREQAHVVTAWAVLDGSADVGASVVIADWRADWIGIGLAEQLAVAGCRVTLCTNAALAGETVPLYTRNHHVGRLQALGVTIRTHARFFGVDGDTAYFQDTLTQAPVPVAPIDTVVLALGHHARSGLAEGLAETLAAAGTAVLAVGDCVAPRTAEEAIYEGFLAGREV